MSPRGREPWPWIVAALLGCMIAGSLSFLGIATANPDALVTDDTWRAGQRFSDALRRARRAAERGWTLEVEAPLDGEAVAVRVRLLDEDGAPLVAEEVRVRRLRPAEGGLDAERVLASGPTPGLYMGRVPLPRSGRWRLVVEAERDDAALTRVLSVRRP